MDSCNPTSETIINIFERKKYASKTNVFLPERNVRYKEEISLL